MKFDLDALERKALAVIEAPARHQATDAGSIEELVEERNWRRAVSAFQDAATPGVVVALIARNRELERALRVVSDPNLVGDVARSSVLELLEKGVVLP